MNGIKLTRRCPARERMQTWTEKICGIEIQFGLRTERLDENCCFRTCPPGEKITICFAHFGYKMPSYSVTFNNLISETTKEDAVMQLIKEHGTRGRWWGFVDEF